MNRTKIKYYFDNHGVMSFLFSTREYDISLSVFTLTEKTNITNVESGELVT